MLRHQRDHDLVVQAETGTGKTLAYLLPIIARIEELRRKSLRAVIVVPTRELAKQVADIAQQLAKQGRKRQKESPPLVVRRFVGEITQLRLNSLASDPPHVVVGTPRTVRWM